MRNILEQMEYFIKFEMKGEIILIYETKILKVGEQAHLFEEEKMIILFGENAPSDLSSYCYNIEVVPTKDKIKTGMNLYIDKECYKITAVGESVTKNLNNLGHITIRFSGQQEADLPGTLHLEKGVFPKIKKGTLLRVE